MTLYDAFISYSHARDKPVAAALQTIIQRLGKPWYRRRALRLFRDDTGLAVTPHLWGTIEQALGQSRFLIVLASPEAAASQWVNKEIAYWLDAKSVDTLLIAVTDGDLIWDNAANDFVWDETNPLPPALKGRFVTEPKWVDLSAYRAGADKGDARFTELAADFAAAIRGVPKDDLLSAEVLQQRRALRLAGSAAVLLLVLALGATTAGILAYRAQQEAVAQRNRAEQTLAAATKTANSLVFDLAQRFRNTVGLPVALVKDILDRSLTLQNQLTASGQATPTLRHIQSTALTESVDTLLAIGDVAGALTAAQRARQIGEALVQLEPTNPEWQRDLAISSDRIGNVLMMAGRREEALVAYRKSLTIRQQLADRDSGNAERQSDLSVSFEKNGDVLMMAGQREEALAAYRKSLAINQQLADSDKGNTGWQRELAIDLIKVGDVLRAAGQREEALADYQKALAIFQQLADSDKGNAIWQRELSISFNKVGDALMEAGQREEALVAYQKGLPIAQQLADSDKGNANWQRDLSIAFNNIGDATMAAGKRDEAFAAYQRSLAIAQQLAASDKGNALWQLDLVRSFGRVGGVLMAANRREEALAAYQKSLAIAEQLADSDKGNTRWQRDLAVSFNNVGDALTAPGSLDAALAAYQKSLSIGRELVEIDKDNALWRDDLHFVIGRIGGIAYSFVLARDFDKGLLAADQAIALAPDKTWLHTNRAHALMFLDRVDEARMLYLQYRGAQNVEGAKSWQTIILGDFAELRQAGLAHPLMDEIEAKFAAGG